MQLRELFDEFPFKADVIPITVQKLLNEPLDVLEDWARAESLLVAARNILPDRPEPLVALYKLLAYSNRFEEALAVINDALELTAQKGGFSAQWQSLDIANPPWTCIDDNVRCFLYSLKATGFVYIRQGRVTEAHEILGKVLKLDPFDLVGASVLFDITSRLTDDDYEFVA